jgi:hypothetical protein
MQVCPSVGANIGPEVTLACLYQADACGTPGVGRLRLFGERARPVEAEQPSQTLGSTESAPSGFAQRGAESVAGLDVTDPVAASNVVDGVRPVVVAAAAAPPAAVLGLDAEAVAATAKRTWTGPLAPARAGHLAESGVPADQLEQIDVVLERRGAHRHALWIAST